MKEKDVTYHCTGCGKLFLKPRRRVKCPKCGHYLTANVRIRCYFDMDVEEELTKILVEEIEKEMGMSRAEHDEQVLAAMVAIYGSKEFKEALCK